MAEFERRRTIRRLWSRLSVAGTTVGVTTASAPATDISQDHAPTPITLDRTPTPHRSVAEQALVISTSAASTAALATVTSSPVPVPVAVGTRASVAVDLEAPVDQSTFSGAPGAVSAGADSVAAPVVPWYERIGHVALGRLSYPWQQRLEGWSIVFMPGRPGLLGGTWTYERRIEIYVREPQTVEEVAFTLAHELGHAVDVTLMSEQNRQRWKQVRAMDPSVPWWVESGATDFSSGSGDWAEAFAVWQVGGQSHSRVAPQPSEFDLRLVALLSGD